MQPDLILITGIVESADVAYFTVSLYLYTRIEYIRIVIRFFNVAADLCTAASEIELCNL